MYLENSQETIFALRHIKCKSQQVKRASALTTVYIFYACYAVVRAEMPG